jgi:hypothetical protein
MGAAHGHAQGTRRLDASRHRQTPSSTLRLARAPRTH